MKMLRFYRKPALSAAAMKKLPPGAQSEWCYNVLVSQDLTADELDTLGWILRDKHRPENFGRESLLKDCGTFVEIGPRLNFPTPWSSIAGSILQLSTTRKIQRIERSLRLGLPDKVSAEDARMTVLPFYDRMTQMFYPEPIASFDSGLKPEPVQVVRIMEDGLPALQAIINKLGLSKDPQDQQIWMNLFMDLRRNPTDLETFQCFAPNDEHSRHGFWKGRLVIDGQMMPHSLMDIVQAPWKKKPGNSLIAFCDDSSAIRGYEIQTLAPAKPGHFGPFIWVEVTYHPTLTAETHCFPSGVCPFPGAETGAGGRIRDNQCVGRGGLVGVGGAGYCIDNLHIPGFEQPWEDDWRHPPELASPLDILIQASNGASDYGNKFGEPLVYGFARTAGIQLPDGRRGLFKPIMYSVGAGLIDDRHVKKGAPEKGMLLVRIGGPDLRVGFGGGPASSKIQGENTSELDFNAVQRGNAEEEQCMNRVIRAAVEMGDKNPIISAHDLGAIGNCAAFTELADPAGAKINLRSFTVGDNSLSFVEIWGNEAQERNALLVWPEGFDVLKAVADREGVDCVIVGQITGDGLLVLHDPTDGTTPLELPLDRILGAIPTKTFELQRIKPKRLPLVLPEGLTVKQAFTRIMGLLSVHSKSFLTRKVDRSVTGRVAQQQCIGPRLATLSDFAVHAHSIFGTTGTALSIGEQPMVGLISPQAMARMAVMEALFNMTGAVITGIEDIRCEANWMLAAKLPGEGAWLYDAACALRDILIEIGSAIDGGKDSLTLAAKTKAPDGTMQIVKAPGQLVIANYAPMPDIRKKATADFKHDFGTIIFVDLANGKNRLGGSALAQVFCQTGDECPDVEDVPLAVRAFKMVQSLIERGFVSAVHDRSDGGLITALTDMAIAGNKRIEVDVCIPGNPLDIFFSQEIGLVLETSSEDANLVISELCNERIPARIIGDVFDPSDKNSAVKICHLGKEMLAENLQDLRLLWEEPSSRLDELQANPDCVQKEREFNGTISVPRFNLSFYPQQRFSLEQLRVLPRKPLVAILRGRGTNGDREMAEVAKLAGFEPYDVTSSDLLGDFSLDSFRGTLLSGGFMDMDVFGAGKGAAAIVRFNQKLMEKFRRFYERPDTFSLGVCNGCQFSNWLGWVPFAGLADERQPRFIQNISGRFESRQLSVGIFPSPAIMLKNMEGSILPIHSAHGEGYCDFPDTDIYREVLAKNLAPIRFVDHDGRPTEEYPLNPNGSPMGITALCSPDGRHLAMMPHPERCFIPWQFHYWPKEWSHIKVSPWLQLFQNAYEWCMQNR